MCAGWQEKCSGQNIAEAADVTGACDSEEGKMVNLCSLESARGGSAHGSIDQPGSVGHVVPSLCQSLHTCLQNRSDNAHHTALLGGATKSMDTKVVYRPEISRHLVAIISFELLKFWLM